MSAVRLTIWYSWAVRRWPWFWVACRCCLHDGTCPDRRTPSVRLDFDADGMTTPEARGEETPARAVGRRGGKRLRICLFAANGHAALFGCGRLHSFLAAKMA